MTKLSILNFLKTNKDNFHKKYHISKLALFGSYAKDNANAQSDVDILYALDDGYAFTFDNLIAFENELKKGFQKKVDLVDEKKLNPLVRMNAQKDFIYV
jgi:predicted nucleotidyltransferase